MEAAPAPLCLLASKVNQKVSQANSCFRQAHLRPFGLLLAPLLANMGHAHLSSKSNIGCLPGRILCDSPTIVLPGAREGRGRGGSGSPPRLFLQHKNSSPKEAEQWAEDRKKTKSSLTAQLTDGSIYHRLQGWL